MSQEPLGRSDPSAVTARPGVRRPVAPGVDATGAFVLVVDDDRALRDSVSRVLEIEGYRVQAVGDGAAALSAVVRERPDAVILDLGLPHVDGLTVCRILRDGGDRTPILVLTARSDVSDRVEGLDAGADDFLTKPFALAELLARLRALLRRAGAVPAPPPEPPIPGPHAVGAPAPGLAASAPVGGWVAHGSDLVLADLVVSPTARRARRGARELELTRTEFDLLELLVRNAGVVLDRSTIHLRIWGYDFGPDSKNLTVYMGYLRTKTEAAGEPRLLHTVRGVGYVART
jgi:two-component system response regulator MprA